VYETRTHGSVRGMMLDMIIQHHPTRFTCGYTAIISLSYHMLMWYDSDMKVECLHPYSFRLTFKFGR